jgi:protein involved in temperature-dependent protein secretion
MQDADERLKSGDLAGARALLIEQVRARPDDPQFRMFLFQLLAVLGEWDKAEIQLRALARIAPDAQMLSVVYGQALAAEKERAKVFAGQVPCPVHLASDWLEKLAQALSAYASNDAVSGDALRDEAFSGAPEMTGEWNDQAFTQIADCDGRFGPAFEAIVAGQWGLIGFDQVAEIRSEGPKDLRDMVWLPVEIAFRSGQAAAALLPVRYPGTEQAGDDDLRLARSTVWRDGPSGQEGLGQHTWFVEDGTELSILSLRNLTTR